MNSLREYLFQIPAVFIAAFFAEWIFILNWLGYKLRVRLSTVCKRSKYASTGRTNLIPTLIIVALLALIFVSSFLTGYAIKPGQRNRFFAIGFAVMTGIVLYLIMELGRPRQGFINLNKAEQTIVNLRSRI